MKRVQTILRDEGYYFGRIDGLYGPQTERALRAMAAKARALDPAEVPCIVPAEWMPTANMSGIVLHWTAGAYQPNHVDLRSYHILIDGDGRLHRGKHSIKDNEYPIRGAYAAHIAKKNSGRIGVSLCGMHGSRERPFEPGPYPITRKQWDTAVEVIRALAARYAIPVRPETIGTHAEYQSGKWDFTVLPFEPAVTGARTIGDRLRREISGVST